MEKQTYESIIEIYVNDELYKAASEDEWDTVLIELNSILKLKGYHIQYDDLPGFKHPSDSVKVWINWDKRKIVTVCYKARTQFKDKNGYAIYESDLVEYDDCSRNIQSLFYAKPFNKGYYLREFINHPGGNYWKDTIIDETNIKNIVKVKDVLNFQKRYWNNPKKLNINKL